MVKITNKTKTSSFGTSKRESHDSSSFYKRRLFDGYFTEPATKEEISNITSPSVGNWADKIYCQSSEKMHQLPDNSIGLTFTSPPYNVGKEYDNDLNFKEYLKLLENVGKEVYRSLRPGGRYVINVANLGRKPYVPLHSFIYEIHTKIGFLTMGEIIWIKSKGANGSCAWGSWQSSKAPRLRDVHEYLIVFSKMSFSRPDNGDSSISKEEFLEATISTWEIPPESAKRVGHPAPFPIELANRVINLYSYKNDVVLDPFVGSGSTCVAAKLNDRYYVGYDISKEYCRQAEFRLSQIYPLFTKGKSYAVSED